ncbi:unnamed protein product, partial [Symbiodinium necroappetens]
VTVPVTISLVQCAIRKRRPVVKKVQDTAKWQALLAEFWARHTYATRFLYTVLPAELYWGDATLDSLNKALATDLTDLFTTGVTVSTNMGDIKLHFAMLGVKGDWVYLRKDWFDMSEDAAWRTSEGPTPFKTKASPLHDIPGLSSPSRALVVSAHTWHIGCLRRKYTWVLVVCIYDACAVHPCGNVRGVEKTLWSQGSLLCAR